MELRRWTTGVVFPCSRYIVSLLRAYAGVG
jgi:hypothetical protein